MYKGYRIDVYDIHAGKCWCFQVFNGDPLIGESIGGTILTKEQAIHQAKLFCDWYVN